MSDVLEYLAIPEDYGRWLGGLRWSENFEAIELSAESPELGLTFAMAGEIAEFVVGFQTSRNLVGFAYVLHFLQLLGCGDRGFASTSAISNVRDFDRQANGMIAAFRAAGPRRMLHAGLFLGTICRDVPRAANPPGQTELDDFLRHGPSTFATHPAIVPELPSLTPVEFQDRVLKAIKAVPSHVLRHWLLFGRGPNETSGDAIADELVVRRPVHFSQTLDALEKRPRLARAVPLVAHLAGALTLPSRRLADESPSIGGYSDVTTRGRPEQILPSQFALDDLEFLRRFAGGELLYYHREQPRSSIDEEMILVIDQGVRTWGDVRLMLSAVALAFARQADRKRTDLRVSTTSSDGVLRAITLLDHEALGSLLEASDLTFDPGEALTSALDMPSDRPRDVILLTHARSLSDARVAAAASQVASGTRLFAVAIDSAGGVELCELRGGKPVVLSRCRVSLKDPLSSGDLPTPVATTDAAWTGDVEPIGFPFRLSVIHPLDDQKYAFDYDGEWILATSAPLGMLHLWKIDGSRSEILPRAMLDGFLLTTVDAIVGVAGGFVVAGSWATQRPVLAHYDVASRSCRVHRPRPNARVHPNAEVVGAEIEWFYIREYHTVVRRRKSAFQPIQAFAIDLGAKRGFDCFDTTDPLTGASERAVRAANQAKVLTDDLLPIIDPSITLPAGGPFIRLIPQMNVISGRRKSGAEFRIKPMTNGKASLKGGRLLEAREAGGRLGIVAENHSKSRVLLLYDLSEISLSGEEFTYSADTHYPVEPSSLRTYPLGHYEQHFAMSRDGSHFARRSGPYNLEVRRIPHSLLPTLRTGRESFHDRLEAELSLSQLLIRTGKKAHLIVWDKDSLRLELIDSASRPSGGFEERATKKWPEPPYDPMRFLTTCSFDLTTWVDCMGHVALLDRRKNLVAMFYVFRHQIAAWLPDGTKLGPPSLIHGPSSPNAAELIANALRTATLQSEAKSGCKSPTSSSANLPAIAPPQFSS